MMSLKLSYHKTVCEKDGVRLGTQSRDLYSA